VVFQDDFESGDLSHRDGHYRWTDSQGTPAGKPVVSDELARSGRYCLKFTFEGNPDPRDDAWSEQRFLLGDSLKDVLLEWYAYYPDGDDGHGPKYMHRRAQGSTNNKFLALWDEEYGRYSVWMGFETEGPRPDPSLVTKVGVRGGGGVGNRGAGQWTPAITDSYRGRWVRFRVRARVATFANNDGVLQLWADDRLVIDNQHLRLYPRGGFQNYLRHGYLMGWANTGFDHTTHVYIDDFTISVPSAY
jgi:hypothetical protein